MFNTVIRNTMRKYLQEYENIQLSQNWDKFLQDYNGYICFYGYDVANKDTAHQVYLKGLSGDIRLFY